MNVNKENYREELERQIEKYIIKVEKLPPGIAIGAIENWVEDYINKIRPSPSCVDKKSLKKL